MTKGDAEAFEKAFVMLAAATNKTVDVITKRAYWVGLEDVPIAVVTEAMGLAMKVAEFFPSVAQLRAMCDEVLPPVVALPANQLALPAGEVVEVETCCPADKEVRTYACLDCLDTGFVYYTCTPHARCGTMALCKRRELLEGDKYEDTHTYVRRCSCAVPDPMSLQIRNTVIAARIDREQRKLGVGKYAPKKEHRRPKAAATVPQRDHYTDRD